VNAGAVGQRNAAKNLHKSKPLILVLQEKEGRQSHRHLAKKPGCLRMSSPRAAERMPSELHSFLLFSPNDVSIDFKGAGY